MDIQKLYFLQIGKDVNMEYDNIETASTSPIHIDVNDIVGRSLRCRTMA